MLEPMLAQLSKAKEGVDVRVMYDGTCEFALLPKSYPKIKKEKLYYKFFGAILKAVAPLM